MTVTFGFYNSVDGDRVYSANEFSSLFDGILTDGIFQTIGDAFEVTQHTGSNMNIIVGSGRCWFDRTWLHNSADLILAVATANPVLPRIDSVIIEVDATDNVRANSIKILTGTPDASPVAPTLTDTATVHQYRLANIAVGAAVTAITNANITSFIGTSGTPYSRGFVPLNLIGDGIDFFLNINGGIDNGELLRYDSDDNNLVPAGITVADLGDVTTQSAPVVDNRIVVYNGTTGDSIKDGGYTMAEILALIGSGGGGGGGSPEFIDQSGGTSDTYGVLAGSINGTNKVFTVSEGVYISGSLKVWLNGQLQTQGSGEDWVETSPIDGTFTFAVAPFPGDQITVAYGTVDPSEFKPDRNLLVDGAMQVAQAGTSETGITTTGYKKAVDMWFLNTTTVGTWSVSQDTTDAPISQGFGYSYKLECTTNVGTPSSTAILFLKHRNEGRRLQHLKKGTTNAEPLTASFLVRSNKTGTFIVELQDQSNNRSISAPMTIDVANTWERKTVTFPGDTTGTLVNDNNNALDINFWFCAGSNYNSGTLATSWQDRDDPDRAVGCDNWADTIGNVIYLTGVQLEVGLNATDFEHRPFDEVLKRVLPYYQKSYDYATVPGTATGVGQTVSTVLYTGNKSAVPTIYFVRKRAIPTITFYESNGGTAGYIAEYDGGGNFIATHVANSNSSENSSFYYTSTNVTAGYTMRFNWVADARL